MLGHAAAHRLVTFPVSHFCEKARWALDFWGVPFAEEGHAPPFHRANSNGNTVPVLFSGEQLIAGSDEICAFVQRTASRNGHVPALPSRNVTDGAAVNEEWELNDEISALGVSARRLVYFHILPDRPLAVDQLAPEGAVPARERWWLSWSMFALTPLMRMGMGINERGCVEATLAIDRTLARIEAILQRQPYLSGNSFGVLDLNFAALCSPLVLPPEHAMYDALWRCLAGAGGEHPLQRLVEQYRDRPACQHVLKCYRLHRRET